MNSTQVVGAVAVVLAGAVLGFLAGRAIPAASSGGDPATGAPDERIAPAPRMLREIDGGWSWSRVASDDLMQFVANLRSVGCPEATIGDIIHARVWADYDKKIGRLLDPLARYWSTAAELRATADQIKALRRERDQVWAALKLETSAFDFSSALSPEKQRYVTEALKTYPKINVGADAPAADKERALQNRKARIEYLSRFLTPEELLDYRIAHDGDAFAVRNSMSGLTLSDAEFRRVFDFLDGQSLNRTNGLLAPDLEVKLRETLGDTRYSQYRQDAEALNPVLRSWARSVRLTEDQTRKLIELRSAANALGMPRYREEAAKIIQDRSLIEFYFGNRILWRGTNPPP